MFLKKNQGMQRVLHVSDERVLVHQEMTDLCFFVLKVCVFANMTVYGRAMNPDLKT